MATEIQWNFVSMSYISGLVEVEIPRRRQNKPSFWQTRSRDTLEFLWKTDLGEDLRNYASLHQFLPDSSNSFCKEHVYRTQRSGNVFT